jgi:hypothetical protein
METQAIITLDGKQKQIRNTIRVPNKIHKSLQELHHFANEKMILQGTVIGVEPIDPENKDSQYVATILYNDCIKVAINATRFCRIKYRENSQYSKSLQERAILNGYIGASVNYVITKVNDEEQMAIGDRIVVLEGMKRKYYLTPDDEGHAIITDGIIAEAVVVGVMYTAIVVDIFGVETTIRLNELCYRRIANARMLYKPGQTVRVYVDGIHISDGEVTIRNASVKKALPVDPYRYAEKVLKEGARYAGVIEYIDRNQNCYVHIPNVDVDVFCHAPTRTTAQPIVGSKVILNLTKIFTGEDRIYGFIVDVGMVQSF